MSTKAEAEARQAALRGWINAGMGSMPLPSSREEFKALGLDVQLALQAADPALFEMFNGTEPLAAEVELRMSQGQLTPADADALDAAGHVQEAARLRREGQQAIWDDFEQRQAAEAEAIEAARPELEAEAEQRRIESLGRAQSQLRQGYVERMMSGQLV